jgi:hypothetical protein
MHMAHRKDMVPSPSQCARSWCGGWAHRAHSDRHRSPAAQGLAKLAIWLQQRRTHSISAIYCARCAQIMPHFVGAWKASCAMGGTRYSRSSWVREDLCAIVAWRCWGAPRKPQCGTAEPYDRCYASEPGLTDGEIYVGHLPDPWLAATGCTACNCMPICCSSYAAGRRSIAALWRH